MVLVEPRILDSARRHGVSDEAMLHALHHPIRVFDVDDDLTLFVGADIAGKLLEVGVADSDEGPIIVHAMKARPQYLR